MPAAGLRLHLRSGFNARPVGKPTLARRLLPSIGAVLGIPSAPGDGWAVEGFCWCLVLSTVPFPSVNGLRRDLIANHRLPRRAVRSLDVSLTCRLSDRRLTASPHVWRREKQPLSLMLSLRRSCFLRLMSSVAMNSLEHHVFEQPFSPPANALRGGMPYRGSCCPADVALVVLLSVLRVLGVSKMVTARAWL